MGADILRRIAHDMGCYSSTVHLRGWRGIGWGVESRLIMVREWQS